MHKPSVAVVGAGLSGVVCARELAGHCSVTLFDKGRGVGGRMGTRRTKDWQADHGAQYFTVKSAPFQEEVARWVAAGWAQEWQARPRVWDGTAWKDKETDSIRRYVGTPKMHQPVKELASRLPDVRLEHEITALVREVKGYQLKFKDGSCSPPFDAVVLAVPSPQALRLAAGHSALVTEACQQAKMRPCFAGMATFEDSAGLEMEMGFVNGSKVLSWVSRDSRKPGREGREVWVLHASAEYSEASLDRPLGEVSE
jgi:renalase